ncbi:6-hydroxymethylpterin diphosphokinase MptE-like protein, partial [Shewanella sp. SG44-2]|uniref:6-hydroxymethylpterin diphosphokinase MptE-like protein n=1 Tax=Shewanella sp. SG44-2 TaxID=2760962 RepID=UPI001C7272B8
MDDLMDVVDNEVEPFFDVNKYGEYYLPSVNRRVFEVIDSSSYYNSTLNVDFKKEDYMFVFVGSDSGLLANYVLNKDLGKGSKVVFIELESVRDLLSIDIPKDRLNNFFIIGYHEFIDFFGEIEFSLHVVRKNIEIIKSVSVKSGFLSSYNILYSRIDDYVSTLFFELSASFISKVFIKCQFENLCENSIPSSILKNKFNNCTAIVVGGGPSLDDNIEWLMNNKHRCIIIAASRVYSKLYNLGVKVDFVVSIDPYPDSFEVNKDFMLLPHETILVNGYHTTPLILGQWTGAKLYLGALSPFINYEPEIKNISQKSPTVINSAIEFAAQLGVEKIVLIGVDFCHSKAGVTHAKDTHGSTFIPDFSKSYDWVKSYSGDFTETPPQLKMAIKSLEADIEKYENISFLNTSVDAAIVKGVIYSETNDISINDITSEQRNMLNPHHYLPTIDADIGHVEFCISMLNTEIANIKILKSLVSKAVYLTSKLKVKPSESFVINKKLDRIEFKIDSKFCNLSQVCKYLGKYEFSHFMTSRDDNVEWEQKEITERFHLYYQAYSTSVNSLLQLMEDSLNRCLARRLEFKGPKFLDIVFKQWEKDQQFARAIIWKNKSTIIESELDGYSQNLLKYTREQFLKQLEVMLPKENITNVINDMIQRAFYKLSLLLSTKNTNALKRMVEYTYPYISVNNDVKRLHFNAKSYCFTLSGNYEKAIDAIFEIPPDLRKEIEVKHIVHLSLSLGLLDVATENLKVLASIYDGYLPKYAKLLSITGQHQSAINIYIKYLEIYPKHVGCLLDFALFLLRLNEVDFAIDCFKTVMGIDPGNLTA